MEPVVESRLPAAAGWARKLRYLDPTTVAVTVLVAGLVGIFLIYPVGSMLLHSFVLDGDELRLANLTLANFSRFFTSNLYRTAALNSLYVSLATVALAVAIGVPLAFVMSRIDIPFKALWTSLLTLPIILPPFVGSYSWILLLGRGGLVTHWLREALGWHMPDIYGRVGMVVAMGLSYFPFVFLMTYAALSSADPYLEESAQVMGASLGRRLRTVVFPMVLPSIGAGAVTVFMRAIGNFGVPAILGGEHYVLPTLIYFQIVGYFNLHTASAIALVNALFSILAIVLLRYVIAKKDYITVRTQTREARTIQTPWARALGLFFIIAVAVVSLAPHFTVLMGSFATKWAGTPWPTEWGWDNYQRVFVHSWGPLRTSLWLASLSTLLCVAVGALLAYVSTRKDFKARWLLDVTVMLPFILPGIVVGVAVLSAFVRPPLLLAGTWMILVATYFIRRMPYVFRSAVASLSQVHPEMEEASQVAGASWGYTFRRVTLPLIAPGLLSGAIITFSTLIGELSTTIIVFSPRYKPLTVAIYEYVISDMLGPAFALGTLLIFAVLACIFVANRLVGQKTASMFSVS